MGGGYNGWQNWVLAVITMGICLVGHCFGKGFLKTTSLFFGLATGYILALVMGVIPFDKVEEAAWISLPRPFTYGVSFHLQPILIMVVIYLVTAVEFIGDTTATAMVCEDRLPTQRELRAESSAMHSPVFCLGYSILPPIFLTVTVWGSLEVPGWPAGRL